MATNHVADSPSLPPSKPVLAAYLHQCAVIGVKPNAQVAAQLDFGPLLATTLNSIDCSATFLGANGTRAVLAVTAWHQGIAHLDLSGNSLDADAVEALARIAATHHSLRSVSLRGNKLSTPSARVLWELVKTCNRIVHLDLTDTGLADEWTTRIARLVELNAHFQSTGFFSTGPPRPVFLWSTVFVGVIGDASQARRFNDHVVPTLNHLLAGCRTRIAAIVMDDGSADANMPLVESKLGQCVDNNNYGLPWLVGCFADGYVSPVAEAVLQRVVFESHRTEPPPLKNKLGEVRGPVHRCPCNAFLFFFKSEADRKDRLDLSLQEKRSAELRNALSASPNASTRIVEEQLAVDVLLATDLYASLNAVYGIDERPQRDDTETDASLLEKMWNYCDVCAPDGRESDVVSLLSFINRPAVPAAFPMVAYGGSGVGRSNTLAALCLALRDQLSAAQRGGGSPGVDSSTMVPQVVIPFVASEAPVNSLVFFLWFVLDAFGFTGPRSAPTIESLMSIVRDCISSYSASAPSIALVIFNLELIGSLTHRRAGPALEWLPHSLPSNVRIVVSVSTDCPALVSLRKRTPQPYEMLLGSASPHSRIAAVAAALEAQKTPVVGLSMQDADPSVVYAQHGVITDVAHPVHALLLKEESDLAHFVRLVPPLLASLGAHRLRSIDEVRELVVKRVPDTCEGIVAILVASIGEHYGALVVASIIQVVAAVPVSIPHLVDIAERLLGAPAFSVTPALVALRDHQILQITADGLVTFGHTKIARGATQTCKAEALDHGIGVVARFMTLELTRRTPSTGFAFRVLPDLLLRSGQHEDLRQLLLDTQLLDDVMQLPGMRVFVVDALFRLQHHYDFLTEIGELVTPHFAHDVNRGFLMQLITDMTVCPRNVFQGALLQNDQSLHFINANAAVPRYPVLKPLNKYRTEVVSRWSQSLAAPIRHSNCDSDHIAVTDTSGTVTVLRSDGSIEGRADAISSYEVVGALVAHDDVVCITAKQLVVWNIATGARVVIDGITCSLSTRALNKERTLLAVVDAETHEVSLLHIARRKTLSTLSLKMMVREARYCGDSVMVISVYDIALVHPGSDVPVMLEHSGIVRAVSNSHDGKIVASAVGSQLWVWTSSGDCMHICTSHQAAINDITFHPNGALIASCDREQNIFLTMSLSGQPLVQLRTHCGLDAAFIAFSVDGIKMMARCGDVLRMWDATTFEDLGGVAAHNGDISFMSVSPSRPMFFTVSTGGEVKGWGTHGTLPSMQQLRSEATTTNLNRCGKVSDRPIADAALSQGRSLCAIQTTQPNCAGSVDIWSVEGECKGPLVAIPGAECAAFCDDCSLYIVQNRKLSLMRVTDAAADPMWSIPLPPLIESNAKWKIASSTSRGLVAAAVLSDRTFRILCYSLATQQLVVSFEGHYDAVYDCFFAGDFVLTISRDQTMRAWSIKSCAECADYRHCAPLTAGCQLDTRDGLLCDANGALIRVAFSESTKAFSAEELGVVSFVPQSCRQIAPLLIALLCPSGSIHIFDLAELRIVNVIQDRQYTSISLSPSPNRRAAPIVVCGTRDGKVLLMELRLP